MTARKSRSGTEAGDSMIDGFRQLAQVGGSFFVCAGSGVVFPGHLGNAIDVFGSLGTCCE